MPKDCLPSTGIAVLDGDKPICFSWLYLTNSAFSMIDWTVCDPKISIFKKAKAIKIAIQSLEFIAIENKVKSIFFVTDKGGLVKLVQRLGFLKFKSQEALLKNYGL